MIGQQSGGSGPCIYVKDPEKKEEGMRLAAHLQTGLLSDEEAKDPSRLMLYLNEDGLSLVQGNLELRGDFTRLLPRLRYNNLTHEILVKAAKIRDTCGMVAVDATAGLGEDSLLLAASGWTVHLYEHDPVIAALLADALRRAAEIPDLAEAAGRMVLHEADSIVAMQTMATAPDMILLDPMFPERQKSALVKKKFQLLQKLEEPCFNGEEMLEAAISACPRKIVVKRPLKGPFLGGRTPSYSMKGKAIRYDCLEFPQNAGGRTIERKQEEG